MSYDITFCSNDKCIYTECMRHLNNAPKNIPVSISDCTKLCKYKEE